MSERADTHGVSPFVSLSTTFRPSGHFKPSCLFETDVDSKDNVLGILGVYNDINMHIYILITSLLTNCQIFPVLIVIYLHIVVFFFDLAVRKDNQRHSLRPTERPTEHTRNARQNRCLHLVRPVL